MIRKHSARTSVSSRVVSTRSPTKDHVRTICKTWTDVAKATGHPERWGLKPTHLVRHLGVRFAELSDPVASLVPSRPCHPRRLLIVSFECMLREIEASKATFRCLSFSGAAAHVDPRAKMSVLVKAQPGPWNVRVRLWHSAWSTFSKSSKSAHRARQDELANHSPVHWNSGLCLVMWPPKCKSAVQCVKQPASSACRPKR